MGVVLSITWLAGVLIYAAYDHHSTGINLIKAINAPQATSGIPEGFKIIGQQSFLTDCEVEQEVAICSSRLGNLAILLFLPIFLTWFLILILVFAFLWVRAGFRGDE